MNKHDAHRQNCKFTNDRLKRTTNPQALNHGTIIGRTTKTLARRFIGVTWKTESYGRNTKQKWEYSIMPQCIHILTSARNQDNVHPRLVVKPKEIHWRVTRRVKDTCRILKYARTFQPGKRQQTSDEQDLYGQENQKTACPLFQCKSYDDSTEVTMLKSKWWRKWFFT